MVVHVTAEGAVVSRGLVQVSRGPRCRKSTTVGESTSGKLLDHRAWKSLALDMVLEDSIEVRRGNTYEQVDSGRG
jgi:hypothetical protein